MIPGEYILHTQDVILNKGKKTISVSVSNKGDRPIQVGSHYHFYEVNPSLIFERIATKGFHLDIPSGNAVRFEAGETKTVTLVEFSGNKIIRGFHNQKKLW